MPFQIVRNDIVKMQVDVIVNTANPQPIVGTGVDTAIHHKAGPRLLEARKKIGPISVGQAAITKGFDLPVKYIIHTVGPAWKGGSHGEAVLLRRCYDNSLALAAKKRCKSIAFPLISTGNYGFPKDLALEIARDAITEFLRTHEMDVYLVVFNRSAFSLSEKLFREVTSFIDENYVQERMFCEYGPTGRPDPRRWQRSPEAPPRQAPSRAPDFPDNRSFGGFFEPAEGQASYSPSPAPVPKKAPASVFSRLRLERMLKAADAGFSETLLRLIDKSGKKDSEIYTKANVSRQHFSKIRKNPDYKPTKPTAIAFAIALELDLEQTRDLIGRAGYALTNSSKFDLIIMYFISEGNYNMFDINAALFEFDQNLLGA